MSFFFLPGFAYVKQEGRETHFIMLMAAYYISGLFQEMWRPCLAEAGIDLRFHRLMSGFESADINFARVSAAR
jgi:hypothetical protein